MLNNTIYNTSWNLKKIMPSDSPKMVERSLDELKMKNDEFIKKWNNNPNYLKDPLVLKNALEEYNDLVGNFGGIGEAGCYFQLKRYLNQEDPDIKSTCNRINSLTVEIENNLQFFTHNLAKVNKKMQKIFLDEPDLLEYRHFLENLFNEAKYLLSDKEEKILNLMGKTSYQDWVSMVSEFISSEERPVKMPSGTTETKNFSEIMSLLSSPDKALRDEAAVSFDEILKKHVKVAEHEINAILESKRVWDDLRGFKTPEASRHIADDIDGVVVEKMITAVTSRFDLSKRYYVLKAKLLGVEKLSYHERNVEYGKLPGNYSYDMAVDLILSVFNKLDPKFSEIVKNLIEEGHVDVYPAKGKTMGAFCVSILDKYKSFVLLNHTGKLYDVLTLAHELGHAINNELIKERQKPLNSDTPTCVAEVASTFFEDFVLMELEKNATDEEKLALKMQRLNDIFSTIHRQVACYNFERDLHQNFREKGYLTSQEIGALFNEKMYAYLGDAVIQNQDSANWWVYWEHLRMFFYVYSYASGLLISKSLQNLVKEDPAFVDKIKDFLSIGSFMSPRDSFLKLGIDIKEKDFWAKGLKEIEDLLNETEVMGKKLGKI